MTDPSDDKPSRAPIALSAFVCPGAGQFMQRRWVTGLFFAAAFLFFFGACLFEVIRPMMTNMRIAIDSATSGSNEPFATMSVKRIAGAFGIALAVYFLSLVDVAMAHRRRVLAWQRAQRSDGGALE